MNLRHSIHELLHGIGQGLSISRSAYDTAWVARLALSGNSMGQAAIEWLREQQLADGSWGTKDFLYYHERLVSTLSAIVALAQYGAQQDRARVQRAQLALETMSKHLAADPAGETIGFEMIVPTLIAEAEELGVLNSHLDKQLDYLCQFRISKLAALPRNMIDRTVTVAFSTEMVGADGLDLLDVKNLREPNGSVAYSPAATTFFYLHVQPDDPAALDYLEKVTTDGAAPYIAPIEIFEQGWALWNLALLPQLDAETLRLCQPHLDLIEAEWKPGIGAAACAGLTLVESDTTSVAYKVLQQFGRMPDLEAVMHYEEENHFRCFQLEANPSLSANIHILDALKGVGFGASHPSVQKVLRFLQRTQTMQMFWFDKWHVSPYYPTAHAIIACVDLANELIQDAVYWIKVSQRKDGAWGYYVATAEETALCLQALVIWKQHGGEVPDSVLKRGAAWLAEHMDEPYVPLWIGKSLYCPELVVRSAVLSALALVESEVGG